MAGRARTARRSAKVDAYIASCPAPVQGQLRRLRSVLRRALPAAAEEISYRMPAYAYPGRGFYGTIVWFGLQRHHIGLYLRPPTIARHRTELRPFTTTKSAVHLPLGDELPLPLIRRLVLASARIARGAHRAAARSGESSAGTA